MSDAGVYKIEESAFVYLYFQQLSDVIHVLILTIFIKTSHKISSLRFCKNILCFPHKCLVTQAGEELQQLEYYL